MPPTASSTPTTPPVATTASCASPSAAAAILVEISIAISAGPMATETARAPADRLTLIAAEVAGPQQPPSRVDTPPADAGTVLVTPGEALVQSHAAPPEPGHRAVDVRRLRVKLSCRGPVITTIRGVGYRLDDAGRVRVVPG